MSYHTGQVTDSLATITCSRLREHGIRPCGSVGRLVAVLAMVVAAGGNLPAAADEDGPARQWPGNTFYAFDNGTGRDQDLPLNEQAKMLKESGYAGIGFTGSQRIPEMLKALDSQGLKLCSIYVSTCVDTSEPPYTPDLEEAIEQLKGRDTLILLTVKGGNASSTDLDDRAVAMIGQVADMAEKSGLRVAIYPHVWFYVARVEDAVRLAKKVGRKNVGVVFNLSHFLKVDDERNLQQRLQEAIPHLFAVSINGADSGQTNQMDWDRLVQTLDRGSFDTYGLLKSLKEMGYTGPIALQCYSIPGDLRENLRRSMEAWRKFSTRLADAQ